MFDEIIAYLTKWSGDEINIALGGFSICYEEH